jgi:hypothetical protein
MKWESANRRWEKSLEWVYHKRKVLNEEFWFTNADGFRVSSVQLSPPEPTHVNSVQTEFPDPLTRVPIQTANFYLFFFRFSQIRPGHGFSVYPYVSIALEMSIICDIINIILEIKSTKEWLNEFVESEEIW